MTKTVTLITSELKKGKLNTKALPAKIIDLGDQLVVILSDRKQKLDTHFSEIGTPKYYLFIVRPM